MQDVTDIADDLTLLAWQVEMGADEAIADAPVDRFEVLPKKIESPEIRQAARTDPSIQYSAAPEVTETRRKVVARAAAPANGAGVEAATSVAASCNTLEELKSAMEAFDGGLLKRSAKNTVFSDGVAGSDLMIVGEAPGAEEDQMGKPFVGVSGQLLDKMLAAIGKSRAENAYISNIVPWRPLGNRTPDQAILTMCLPFIRRHIELAHPKVILLLGGVAAKSLLETEDGITRLRGKWRDLSFGEHKIAAMPTYHPAYLLRQPAQKGHSWRDLLAVKDKITSLS